MREHLEIRHRAGCGVPAGNAGSLIYLVYIIPEHLYHNFEITYFKEKKKRRPTDVSSFGKTTVNRQGREPVDIMGCRTVD